MRPAGEGWARDQVLAADERAPLVDRTAPLDEERARNPEAELPLPEGSWFLIALVAEFVGRTEPAGLEGFGGLLGHLPNLMLPLLRASAKRHFGTHHEITVGPVPLLRPRPPG